MYELQHSCRMMLTLNYTHDIDNLYKLCQAKYMV